MNVWKYECMNVCMYVRSKSNGVPYHLWAKMLHPEDLPHIFWKPKKHMGGYISCGQVKYFSEFSCLTPPRKYSRVKAGGFGNVSAESKIHCRWSSFYRHWKWKTKAGIVFNSSVQEKVPLKRTSHGMFKKLDLVLISFSAIACQCYIQTTVQTRKNEAQV
jgi:hypothetical protein